MIGYGLDPEICTADFKPVAGDVYLASSHRLDIFYLRAFIQILVYNHWRRKYT